MPRMESVPVVASEAETGPWTMTRSSFSARTRLARAAESRAGMCVRVVFMEASWMGVHLPSPRRFVTGDRFLPRVRGRFSARRPAWGWS
jgi:hypothetical protein